MDKKFLIKVLLFNTLWVVWIGLSIFFGCLIADAYFPDNIATFIPFSLIFIVGGGAAIFCIYKFVLKKKIIGKTETTLKTEGSNSADSSDDETSDSEISEDNLSLPEDIKTSDDKGDSQS